MTAKRKATVGKATLIQHPRQDNIYILKIGDANITVWMSQFDPRYATSVNVHNVGDTKRLVDAYPDKTECKRPSSVWLNRE